MMDRNTFSERVNAYALRVGCRAAETFYAASKAFSVTALGGEVDAYEVSNTAGVSVRVNVNGRDGYAYTERLDEPERLVDHAIDNAGAIEQDDPHPMQSMQAYRPVERADCPIDGMDVAEKIALALGMEQAAKKADPRVQRVMHCTVETAAGEVEMRNTLGLAAARRTGLPMCYLMPVVQQGDEVQTATAFRMGTEAHHVEACAEEAVATALSRLGAKPVPSGTYQVVIQNMAMAELLRAFLPMFSAEEAQKGCSLLNGREGEQIAADCVTLTDDPFHPLAPRAFDGEGTPCQTKHIIDHGVLTTLLHNLKTARKAGVESTGNAVRASAASPIGVGPSILILHAADGGEEDLPKRMGSGLLITDFSGLHAGVDAVSGDFSLQARGRLIENGVDVCAVSGVTLAGNMLHVLQSVACVGNQVRFAMPSGAFVASADVLVPALTVAGS